MDSKDFELVTSTLKDAALSFSRIADWTIDNLAGKFACEVKIERAGITTWYISRITWGSKNGIHGARDYFLTTEKWQFGFSGWTPTDGWVFSPDVTARAVTCGGQLATPQQLEQAALLTADLIQTLVVRNWAERRPQR
jgi:hypothetical protein